MAIDYSGIASAGATVPLSDADRLVQQQSDAKYKDYSVQPQTDKYYSADPHPFDSTGWTQKGGNSTSDVWVNDKTGEVAYVGKDGRVQDVFSSWSSASAGEGSITDVIPGGSGYKPSADEIAAQDKSRQSLADFATELTQTRDQYGAGTTAGTAPQIGEFGVTAAPVASVPPTAAPPAVAAAQPASAPATMTPPSLPGGVRGDFNAANPASAPTTQQQLAGALATNKAAGVATTGADMGGVAGAAPTPAPAPVNHGPSIYGGPAASMEAAQSMGAPKIDTKQIGANATTIAAPTIAAPGAIVAPKMDRVPGATAQQIAQPGAVTAQQVGAQTIGPVGLGTDASANKASQDAAQAMLAGAAAGNAPSAAEALLRKGIDENEGAALGMAATFQGSRPGLALRTGLQGSRAAVAKSAADMAALRATEQATARGQYQEATTQARGQDIQAASTNLQAQIDTLKANQQTALAAGNSNAANAIQAQIATLQGQLDASKANQQSALQATLATQATQADAAKANAANQLQAQIVSMQQQIDVAKQNAANALAAGQSNQAAALQAQIATMTSQLDGLKANQASALSTATTNAGLTQQANLTNANLEQNQAQFGATQQLTAAEKNQQAQLMQEQLNNQQYMGLTQLQQQALIAPYQAMIQQQQIAQQQAAADQAFWGQIYASGAMAVAASDVTLKTDVSDGAVAALDFLDALPDPVTYRYIDEKAHYPGKQLGVIAQKLPPAVVTTGPDGKKWISANVIGQVLAGLGSVHKRLGKIEERREITRLTPRAGRDTVPPSDVAEFARRLAS